MAAVLGGLALAAPSSSPGAEPHAWAVSLQVGTSVLTEACGMVAVQVSRRVVRGLEGSLRLRTVLGELRKQIDAVAGLGWRWWMGRFTLRLGGDVGVGALRGIESVVTRALLLGPDLELGVRWGRLHPRAGLGVTFYYNRLWLAAWEPRVSFGVSF